ncbi:hypothetical protein B2M20_01385 [Nitrobacter vulgaris]|uniref:Uncharacterized protein n=1 Tax=Nitrobacter vulgaris TaxID=29421 RepID=A0A1V4I2I9_NITVU|nr:hypothetical protein B2M20_01385 [Nitrobacter vulgaris]
MVFRSGVRMRPILDLGGAGEFNIHAPARLPQPSLPQARFVRLDSDRPGPPDSQQRSRLGLRALQPCGKDRPALSAIG